MTIPSPRVGGGVAAGSSINGNTLQQRKKQQPRQVLPPLTTTTTTSSSTSYTSSSSPTSTSTSSNNKKQKKFQLPKLMSITETDLLLCYAVVLVVPSWLFLLAMVYATAPTTEYLEGPEQKAAAAAFCVFAVSIALTCLPLLIQHRHNPHHPLHRNNIHKLTNAQQQNQQQQQNAKTKKEEENDPVVVEQSQNPQQQQQQEEEEQQQQQGTTSTSTNNKYQISGTLLSLLVIETISLVTNGLLAFAPVVVRRDPITLGRVFLVRWCEWIPLAGFMTFLSEGIDFRIDPGGYGIMIPFGIGLGQSLSCFCGMILPFCPGFPSWCLMLCMSCALYLTIFPRVRYKYQYWTKIQKGLSSTSSTMSGSSSGGGSGGNGGTVSEVETYHRIRCAYDLLWTCSALWTILVILYFTGLFGRRYCNSNHFLHDDSFNMVSESIFDVVAKCLYTKIILEVHEKVFDSECRAHRHLTELSKLMSALWETGSDVVVISVKDNDRVTTVLSPTFATMVGATDDEDKIPWMALVVVGEIPKHHNRQQQRQQQQRQHNHHPHGMMVDDHGLVNLEVYFVDGTSTIPYPIDDTTSNSTAAFRVDDDFTSQTCLVREARKIANVLYEAKSTETLIVHDLTKSSSRSGNYHHHHSTTTSNNNDTTSEGEIIRCELKLTRENPPEGATIAIMRDVTERYLPFEAERKAHSESLLRQKDVQSVNRFTSHEIKNGLLAGIEVCDYLHNAMEDLKSKTSAAASGMDLNVPATRKTTLAPRTMGHQTGVSRYVTQLEGTLHGVLDTVLAEAMARDVVQEVYRPKLERVDIQQLLTDTTKVHVGTDTGRFKVKLHPPNMPALSMDPQLIKYIHRNAVSNACKYGANNGDVISDARYSTATNEFVLDVINFPGDMNDSLVKMGQVACESVFSPGTRLHDTVDDISSGDGAWIMQQCAKTMGGVCSIRFGRDRTLFTFRCQAEVHSLPWNLNESFEVPHGTWGVAIDDSVIQQRLLTRVMTHVGVENSKKILCGKTPEEVENIEQIIVDILVNHPKHFLLILVDENLDYSETHGTRFSGSKVIQDVLAGLTPEQEARVLALVRSADDSAEDIALYRKRAHGFFPKSSMPKERAREILAPFWTERFRNNPNGSNKLIVDAKLTRDKDSRLAPISSSNTAGGTVAMSDLITKEELIASLGRVEKFLDDTENPSWPDLWSKLHVLKGDLRATEFNDPAIVAEGFINDMRGGDNGKTPRDFDLLWENIQAQVLEAAEQLQ